MPHDVPSTYSASVKTARTAGILPPRYCCMTCHNCKHNAEIARLRSICTKCCAKSRKMEGAISGSVSLDAVIEGTEDGFLKVAPGFSMVAHDDPADKIDGEVPAPSPLPLSQETTDALLRLVHEFAALPPVVAYVLHGLLNRRTVTYIAKQFGWSKARLYVHVRKALRRFPMFAAVYRATRMAPNGSLAKSLGKS